MALHRVRLDSPSSGGVNPENDQDDEMAIEKQRLDIIEVLLFAHARHWRYVASVVYLYMKKARILSIHHRAHAAPIH